MKITRFLLPTLALGAAAALYGPQQEAHGFSKLIGSLGIAKRDFRIRNGFADSTANNNNTPDPNYPGAQGAVMALWKAAAEWGSGPHGDGSGDPTQANLGDGGANFDFVYMGISLGGGTGDDNIASVTSSCSGGVLAFVSGGGSNWEMKFCENWVWDDGPGFAPGGRFSIQGVGTHEFGHALGLGHSSPPAVMKPSTGSGNDQLNLSADDKAGVQCLYGVKAADKPTITGVSISADVITLTGTNFDASNNEVWFTPSAETPWNDDPRVRLFGVASTLGGTRIETCIPGEAGPGNVMVRRPGTDGSDLSNAYPVDISVTPVDAEAAFHNGTGCNLANYTVTEPPVVGGNWGSDIVLEPGMERSLLAISLTSPACHPGGFKPSILGGTELLALPPYLLPHDQNETGRHVIPIAYDCDLVGQDFCTQGFGLSFGPLVRTGFNAQIVTVGNQLP